MLICILKPYMQREKLCKFVKMCKLAKKSNEMLRRLTNQGRELDLCDKMVNPINE